MFSFPMRLEIQDGETHAEAVARMRSGILKRLDQLGLKGELREAVVKRLEEALEETLKEGPGVASAKSLIGAMKDAHRMLDEVPDGLLSLAKLVTRRTSGNIFVLGGLAADIATVRMLLDATREKLRDLLDENPWEEQPKPEKKQPEHEGAAAQA